MVAKKKAVKKTGKKSAKQIMAERVEYVKELILTDGRHAVSNQELQKKFNAHANTVTSYIKKARQELSLSNLQTQGDSMYLDLEKEDKLFWKQINDPETPPTKYALAIRALDNNKKSRLRLLELTDPTVNQQQHVHVDNMAVMMKQIALMSPEAAKKLAPVIEVPE